MRTSAIVVAAAMLLASCEGEASESQPETPTTERQATETSTPAPTNTVLPTASGASSTDTPTATASPEPSPTETPAPAGPSSFTVTFIDVGQGDATLVEVGGELLLIDGGRGTTRIQTRLNALGITDLDALAMTHPDADHVAGLVKALAMFQVERVYVNGGQSGSQTFATFMSDANSEGAVVTTASRGQTIPLGGLDLQVLHPSGITGDSNEDSLVILLTCGTVDVLITGDATIASESSMLAAGVVPDLDVLRVGHHGSKTSTSAEFLAAASPEFGVISAGQNSQFGHPDQEVVDRLIGNGVQILHTDTTDGDDTFTMTSDCSTFSFSGGGWTPPGGAPAPTARPPATQAPAPTARPPATQAPAPTARP